MTPFIRARLRKLRRRSYDQAGFVTMDYLMGTMLVAVALAGGFQLWSWSEGKTRAANAAGQMRQVEDAFRGYINANLGDTTVFDFATAGTTPIEVDMADLVSGQYLPVNFSSVTPYGHDYRLFVRHTGLAATDPYEAVVLSDDPTDGDLAIPLSQLAEIRDLLHGSGAFTTDAEPTILGTAPVDPTVNGSFYVDLTNYPSDVRHAGQAGAVIHVGANDAVRDVLYRVQIPNAPQANRMLTDLAMSGNDVDNPYGIISQPNDIEGNPVRRSEGGAVADVNGRLVIASNVQAGDVPTIAGTSSGEMNILAGGGLNITSLGTLNSGAAGDPNLTLTSRGGTMTIRQTTADGGTVNAAALVEATRVALNVGDDTMTLADGSLVIVTNGGTVSVDGNTAVTGTLSTTGDARIGTPGGASALTVEGTVASTGSATVGDGSGGDTLTVNGNTTMNGALSVSGAISDPDSAVTINDALTVAGNIDAGSNVLTIGTVNASSDVTAAGTLRGGTLAVTGDGTVGGNLTVTSNITAANFYYSSDRTLKTDIEQVPGALASVKLLRGVRWRWKENGERSMGVIAQELQKIYPELVVRKDGLLRVNYAGLTGPLIEAIRELSAEVEANRRAIEEGQRSVARR